MNILYQFAMNGIVRQIIQGIGAAGVGAGIITAEQNTALAGALASIIAIILEVIANRSTKTKIADLESAVIPKAANRTTAPRSLSE